MKDLREEWYDAENKVAVTMVDVTSAAQALANGHLSGPIAAHFLTRALASVALLGAETNEKDESVIIQMKCKGPLGGFNVECSADGALRGYTERKTLEDFDGTGITDPRKIVGERQIQVTRSIPGKILSQGISTSLDGYLAGSLQRKAVIFTEASVSDEVEVLEARGIMVEALPDSNWSVATADTALGGSKAGGMKSSKLAVSSRKILDRLGLSKAELKRTTPLFFACRCSPDRAVAMLAGLPESERAALPPTIDITCHMCGRVFTVKTGLNGISH